MRGLEVWIIQFNLLHFWVVCNIFIGMLMLSEFGLWDINMFKTIFKGYM